MHVSLIFVFSVFRTAKMKSLCLLLFVLSTGYSQVIPCNNITAAKDFELCYLGDFYESTEPPTIPTKIDITMMVKDVLKIDEEANTITLFLDIVAQWADPTLYHNRTEEQVQKNLTWILMWNRRLNEIWRPIFHFVNAIDMEKLGAFGKEHTKSLWYRYPSRFWYSEIVKLKIACEDIRFSSFPFDEHYCQLQIRNWIGGSADVHLNRPHLYVANGSKEMTSLTYENPKLHYDLQFHAEESVILNQYSFQYSMASIGIKLKRSKTGLVRILGSYFVPLGTFAILSMISFFIDSAILRINFSTKLNQ